MGGKSGGGAQTPIIWANTLHGANKSKHVDLISSGEIFGFENGNDEPLKSIYLNDTPIQNQDGTLNFSGVRVEYNRGSVDQDYLPSFSTIDRNVDVGAQVKKNVPITRSVTNGQVTSIRVTVGVDALSFNDFQGNQWPTSVSMTIMLMKDNQIYTSKIMILNEKGSKPFRLDFVFDDLPAAPFEIRCVRNTEDSNDDMLRNNTYFFNYVESIDAKMSYPLSSVVGIEIDAEQFGNNSTTRTYGVKGVIVQVPSNYDPVARTYSGLWDRLFKPAYTNNPAWVFHDLLTNEVDGFGSKFKGFNVDIDTLYQLSKYCDELVDDGKGGKEPRFVCNAVIMGDDAYKVLYDVCSIFRGVPSYSGQLVTTYYDKRSDVTAIYTNSNVIDGLFEYGQVERDKQYNQIQVQYVDQYNGYESTIVEVSDDDHIAKNGINSLSTVAFGQTKESYALRNGSWTLVTSLTETETVSFGVGDQGIKHEVYDIIQIADNDYIGTTLGARIKSVDGIKIILDRELNHALKFSIETINGPQNFNVKRQVSANEYELDKAPMITSAAQCTAILEEVKPRLFRCLSIEENDDRTYTISAIQHNSQKEAIVDKGAQYVPENTTVINPLPSLSNGIADNDGRAIILRWDSLAVIGTNNTYRIQLFRDKALYQTFETKETFLRLENLPQGEYIAKIRAINEKGQHSAELIITFSTTYKIDGLRAKGVVFGIQLNWQLPALITSDAFTEIWYSAENDRMTATKLSVVTYPQSQYLFSGLSVTDEFYFWLRLVDSAGNQGEFGPSILGKPSDNADDILGYLDGKIGDKEISKDLQDQFDKNIDDKVEKAKEEIKSEIDRIEIDLTGINSEIDNIKTDITKIDSELVGINADIAIIDSDIDSVKESAEKALSDAEKNAQEIKEQSTVIDSVSKKQGEAEANWQLAQMSNVSAHKSEFARSMSMSAQVAQNIAKIEEIDSFIVTEKEATATRFTQINTRVDGAESKITSVEQSLSSDIKAEASKREALEVVFDLSKAQQQLQLMTQATADQSLSSRLFSMSASTANAHAKYDELQEVVATNEDARVTSEQKLQAEIDSSKANITRLDEVMTSEFASQATSISNLSSELDGAKANIKKAEQVIVDNEKSQAKKNDEFGTQFDESEAKQQLSILTESTSSHSLSQRYILLSAQTANSTTKIENLQKVFVDSETAWAVTEERLQSQIDNSKSEISRIEKVSNERDKAQSVVNESLKSELDTAKSGIDRAEKTIADNENAQAKIDQQLASKIDGNSASQQLQLITQSSNDASLSHRYFSLSAQTANSSAKIESLEKVFADSEVAWSVTEQRLQSQLDSSKSEISRIDKTVTDNEKSQAQAMSSLSSEIGNAKSSISNIESTVAEDKKNQAITNQNLSSEIDGAKSDIQDVKRTQVTDKDAQALINKNVSVEFGKNRVDQQLSSLSQVTGDKSSAISISSIDVEMNSSKVNQTLLSLSQTTADKALAMITSSLSAEAGENKANITQISEAQASLDGKVSALYTLKVEANGAVGGIMLGANEKESMFKVAADNFVVSTGDQSKNLFTIQEINGKQAAGLNVDDFIINGSVSGDKFQANTSIQSPLIKGGTVEGAHLKGGDLNINNGACTIASNGDFYARNGRFEGVIYANKIEGPLGIIHRLSSVNYQPIIINNRIPHVMDFGVTQWERSLVVMSPLDVKHIFAADPRFNKFELYEIRNGNRTLLKDFGYALEFNVLYVGEMFNIPAGQNFKLEVLQSYFGQSYSQGAKSTEFQIQEVRATINNLAWI